MSSGGTTTTEPRRWPRGRIAAVVTAAIAAVLVLYFVYVGMVIPREAGNVNSGVACDDLPSRTEVEAVLKDQAGLVERIRALDASVDVEAFPCSSDDDGGSEIVIFVPSRSLSDEVRRILKEEPFGAPTSIRNV
jgi:hypothetical protein